MKHLIGIAFAFALTVMPALVSAQDRRRFEFGNDLVFDTTTRSAPGTSTGTSSSNFGFRFHRDEDNPDPGTSTGTSSSGLFIPAPGQGKKEEAALDENEDDPDATSVRNNNDWLIWGIGGPGAKASN